MKLLGHMHFDNPSIKRRRLRKPPPGSDSANKLTGWAPDLAGRRPIRRASLCDERPLERSRWGPGGSDILPKTTRIIVTKPAGLNLCGIHRWKRSCNACHFGGGQISECTRYNTGTAMVPKIKSRTMSLFRPQKQDFSDLQAPLDAHGELEKHVPRQSKVLLAEILFAVCCPGCAVWQEKATFTYHQSIVPYLDKRQLGVACVRLEWGAQNVDENIFRTCMSMVRALAVQERISNRQCCGELLHLLQKSRPPLSWAKICGETKPGHMTDAAWDAVRASTSRPFYFKNDISLADDVFKCCAGFVKLSPATGSVAKAALWLDSRPRVFETYVLLQMRKFVQDWEMSGQRAAP